MGVETVILLHAEPNRAGDIGPGLVGVELNGTPPAGNGGVLGPDGGDGSDEPAYNLLLSPSPGAVPDGVDGDVVGEDGAHVVLEVDELGGALILLGPAEDEVRGVEPHVWPGTPCG